jgi:hypothetical protein
MRLLEFLAEPGCVGLARIQPGMHHRLWEFSRGEGDSNHNLRCFAIHLPQWIAGEASEGAVPQSECECSKVPLQLGVLQVRSEETIDTGRHSLIAQSITRMAAPE